MKPWKNGQAPSPLPFCFLPKGWNSAAVFIYYDRRWNIVEKVNLC